MAPSTRGGSVHEHIFGSFYLHRKRGTRRKYDAQNALGVNTALHWAWWSCFRSIFISQKCNFSCSWTYVWFILFYIFYIYTLLPSSSSIWNLTRICAIIQKDHQHFYCLLLADILVSQPVLCNAYRWRSGCRAINVSVLHHCLCFFLHLHSNTYCT